MAMWFQLKVNAEPLGQVEIQRREHLDLTDPAVANEWCTYDVRLDRRHVGQVRHRYGDGRWRLLALAIGLIAEADIEPVIGRAQREIAQLTRIAMDVQLAPDARAKALLTAHPRRDVGSCLCGWAELGKSHSGHQAEVLAKAGLLAAADHGDVVHLLQAGHGLTRCCFRPPLELPREDRMTVDPGAVTCGITGSGPSICGMIQPTTPPGHMPYRCSEPHGHELPHRATLDGRVLTAWRSEEP